MVCTTIPTVTMMTTMVAQRCRRHRPQAPLANKGRRGGDDKRDHQGGNEGDRQTQDDIHDCGLQQWHQQCDNDQL